MVSTLEQMQVPNGTGSGVRRSKRPLFAKFSMLNLTFDQRIRVILKLWITCYVGGITIVGDKMDEIT